MLPQEVLALGWVGAGGVGLGVGAGGVGVGVAGGGVGVGVELHAPVEGPWTATVMGVPFLKKPIVAAAV